MKDKILSIVSFGIIGLIIFCLGYLIVNSPSVNIPVSEQSTVVDSSPSKQEQALLDEGYTDISITGTAFYQCSNDDSMFASNTFTAKNSNGRQVNGAVCCGLLFKGCTVRH